MERTGIPMPECFDIPLPNDADPILHIICLNIRRRHLTKQQQADLIVAAIKAPRQDGEVPTRHVKGKAGSEKDAEKAKAVAAAKDHGISQRTVERSIAKAEGKPSKPKSEPKEPAVTVTLKAGLKAAREHYALEFAELSVREQAAEMKLLLAAIDRAIEGKGR
jgi:hypothetical protein